MLLDFSAASAHEGTIPASVPSRKDTVVVPPDEPPEKDQKAHVGVQAPAELPDELLGFECIRRHERAAGKAQDDQPREPDLEHRPIRPFCRRAEARGKTGL